ncbi:MAG: hybrid sensor histidine kinase/response regulator [Chloroflexi bacterium]|nr:hybrid sensor histidine kinase/response regulator [Chloroflexota bacterium]
MEPEKFNVLLVEDNPADARLIKEYIIDFGDDQFDLSHVETLKDTLSEVSKKHYDLILLDLSLPDSQGFDTFKEVSDKVEDVPVILLTGLDDESMAIKAVHGGAQDYIVKGKVDGDLIVRSMRYAIERERLSKEIERTREEFTALLAHDLKSPLVAVVGFADLIADPSFGVIAPKKLEYVNMIRRSVDTMLNMIDNIVGVARLDAGHIEPEREDFLLPDLLKELQKIFMPRAVEKHIAVDFKCPEDIWVCADLRQIKQVFHNLLSNAFRYTPVNGKIWINAKQVENRVLIEVGDTGRGISESDEPKLFKKYGKLESNGPGTGLGLYIVKKILENHGSEITLKSKPGEGTVFYFNLPAGSPVQLMETRQ